MRLSWGRRDVSTWRYKSNCRLSGLKIAVNWKDDWAQCTEGVSQEKRGIWVESGVLELEIKDDKV